MRVKWGHKYKWFCSISPNFQHDEAGLIRNRFYYCRCVVAINAKEIYRFEVRPLKRFLFRRFLCKALVRRDFVIRDFYWRWRKKYPEKVTSSTIQANMNSFMFRAEFLVKKLFLTSAGFSLFPAKVLAGNEFQEVLSVKCSWKCFCGDLKSHSSFARQIISLTSGRN